jgi:hypothetical protein
VVKLKKIKETNFKKLKKKLKYKILKKAIKKKFKVKISKNQYQ